MGFVVLCGAVCFVGGFEISDLVLVFLVLGLGCSWVFGLLCFVCFSLGIVLLLFAFAVWVLAVWCFVALCL